MCHIVEEIAAARGAEAGEQALAMALQAREGGGGVHRPASKATGTSTSCRHSTTPLRAPLRLQISFVQHSSHALVGECAGPADTLARVACLQ